MVCMSSVGSGCDTIEYDRHGIYLFFFFKIQPNHMMRRWNVVHVDVDDDDGDGMQAVQGEY